MTNSRMSQKKNLILEIGISDLFGIWSLEFGILGLRQQSYDFHMVGLRKHIHEAEPLEAKSSFRKEAEVSRKGGGFTRGIDDSIWFQFDHLI